jgi:hypothetical protein
MATETTDDIPAVREPEHQTRMFVDKNEQVQRVNPIQVPDAVAQGWREVDHPTAAGLIRPGGMDGDIAPAAPNTSEMGLGNIPYNAEALAFHHGLAPILGIAGKSKFKMDEPQEFGETAPDKYSLIRSTAGKTARHVTRSIKELMGEEQPNYEHEEPDENHADKSLDEARLLTGLTQTPEGEVARVAENTNDLGMNAPVHAGMLGAVAVRARQVLDSMKPKDPAPPLFGTGDWKPSEAELMNYDQVKSAVLEPKSVFRDASHGTLTDIGWKAFSHVYPTIANDYSQELIRHAVEKNVPETINQKRVFGMVTGITPPELAPENVAFLQNTFAPQGQGQPAGDEEKVRSKGADELSADKNTANPTESNKLSK